MATAAVQLATAAVGRDPDLACELADRPAEEWGEVGGGEEGLEAVGEVGQQLGGTRHAEPLKVRALVRVETRVLRPASGRSQRGA